MTRLLLTLLALLTGLAAQVSPAQARICAGGETVIGAVEGAVASVRVAVQASQTRGPVARREQYPRTCPNLKAPRKPVYIPSVQLGSDRSRD